MHAFKTPATKKRQPELLPQMLFRCLGTCFLLLGLLLAAMTATAAADPQKPVVTSDETSYDDATGRYHLTGNVTVTNGDRVTRMDDAQVSATNLEIWGEGNVTLMKGDEAFFTADAVYLEGFAPSTTLFGRVRFERPGLIIRAESATCDWTAKTAAFHGHVIWITDGKEQIAGTLVYDFESGSVQQYTK